jgi:hypothetical protein
LPFFDPVGSLKTGGFLHTCIRHKFVSQRKLGLRSVGFSVGKWVVVAE